MQKLDPQQFEQWKNASQDRAENRDMVEIIDDLVSLAENGETMTMADAKILGIAYNLKDRVE